MDIVRVGIIGVGNMGSSHAKKIVAGEIEGMTLAAIADTNPARLEWAKENCPGAELFSDAIEMMDSGKVDAVIVATPHYDHPVLVTEALKRDLHALCEKPAGVYTKAVREVNELASRSKATYAIMFNQRTNCVYRKMKEIVESGTMGRIRRTNWLITNWYRPQSYYDSGAWRATWAGEGGGVLLNQCPHNLDLWQWICGMPVKIQSHVHYGKWHDIEVEDDVTTYVEYANGATGVFITTTGDAYGTNRFEIQMDKAKLVVEDDVLTVLEYDVAESEFTKTNTVPFGRMGAHPVEIETDGKSEQHVGVLNAWADAILRGGEMIAHGSEGINGLTLSNAMHLSSFLGKPIDLPLDEDLYYEELMKRVKTSRLKENVSAVFADTSNTYGGAK